MTYLKKLGSKVLGDAKSLVLLLLLCLFLLSPSFIGYYIYPNPLMVLFAIPFWIIVTYLLDVDV